ncbi:hypothetical protein ACP4OV_022496 [Aristida adscensionis]
MSSTSVFAGHQGVRILVRKTAKFICFRKHHISGSF